MGCNEKLIFVLSDVLPTIYDVAISIYQVSANRTSDRMCECINAYVASLVEQWIKAFGVEHVLSRKYVRERVQTIVNHCAHRTILLQRYPQN